MANFMLDKAEQHIARLEAERDHLRAELAELKAWQERVREVVNPPALDDDYWDDLD